MKNPLDKTRDLRIDLIRGCGIILVVLGHSGFPLTPYIYMFHMALFFIISGWCSFGSNKDGFFKFLKKKIKRLYVPYIVYGIVFVILHDIFIHIGFYTTDPRLLNLESTFHKYSLSTYYSLYDIVKQIIRTFLFANNEQLLGISWFVRSLFIVSVLGYFLNNKKKTVQGIVLVLCMTVSYILSCFGISLPLGLENVFPCMTAYCIGLLLKGVRFNELFSNLRNIFKWLLVVISTVAIYVCNKFGTISLGLNQIINPIVYIFCTLAGFILIYFVVDKITQYIPEKLFTEFQLSLGRHSMHIMWLHFTCFKIVTFVIILVLGLPHYALAAFPVLYGDFEWIPYTVVGVLLPFIFESLVRKTQKRVKS